MNSNLIKVLNMQDIKVSVNKSVLSEQKPKVQTNLTSKMTKKNKCNILMKFKKDSRVDAPIPVVDLARSFESHSPRRNCKVYCLDKKYSFVPGMGTETRLLIEVLIDNIQNIQSLTKKSNFVTYQIHKISPGKQIYFHKAQYFKKAMEKWKGHGLVKEKPKLRKTIGLKREPKFDKSHEGEFLRVEGRNEKVAEEKERVFVGRNKTFYRSNPRHLRGILNRFKRNNSEEARKASRKVLVTKSTLK